MTRVKGSITHRRARVNVESDLLADGVDQYLVSKIDAPTLSGDFSICLYDDRASAQSNKMLLSIGNSNAEFVSIRTGFSGTTHPYGAFLISGGVTVNALSNSAINTDNENQDWINKKTAVVINFIQSQTKIECFINGQKQWEHVDANFTGLTFTGKVHVFGFHGAGLRYNGKVCHVGAFKSIHTKQQANYFYEKAGLIHPDLHDDNGIVFHEALTERYAYDDGVDNLFFDVVEQYNYKKVTPLTANHLKAINFTDAELGVINPSSEVVKKDFYDKDSNNWGILNFLDTGDKLTFASNTDWDHIVYEGTAALTLNIAGLSVDASAIGYVNWLEIQDVSNNVLTRLNFNEVEGTTVVDVAGGNNATLSGWTTSETTIAGGAWTEFKSKFPVIIQSLLHETGISIGAAYTSIVGMGFTIQLQTDIAVLSEIITGLPTITGFHVNGVSVANEAAVVSALNLNQLIHIDLEWASASPTITFVHSGEDYYLIRDYYLDQQLSKLEKKKLTNNILFANPDSEIWKTKFNYYALHNEGNYIEGASNPENIPLIDVDTIGNRESLGWTGATAADKLADLVANIVLINSLR